MTWWHYLLLVNFYLILFFCFYALLLRKETFFQLNRIYLVVASMLSFLIPLIQADWVKNLFITQQVQRTVYSGSLNFNLAPVFVASAKNTGVTFGDVINTVYIAVTLFLVVRLVWQLLILKKIINQPSPSAAYSFFKKISLGENMSQSSVIAQHEAVHATQWHSVDVMIIETVMIINWFNPVVYLYRFAVKHIHEFIADQQVIKRGTDKADYALLLLSQTFNTDVHRLVTPFYNHSLLKQRIRMLQKNRSHRMMLAKYGLSAPLFILMLILSSATVKNSKAVNIINKQTEKALQMQSADVMSIIDNNGEIPDENKIGEKLPMPIIIPAESPIDQPVTDASPDNKIFSQVERQPMFPGGIDGFAGFLSSAIHYPEIDRLNNIQGRAIVTFIVERDGSLSNIVALRGPSESIKKAAVDALSKSPKWTPGYQNGHVVRVSFTVPVNFFLDQPAANSSTITADAYDPNKVYNQAARQPNFPGGLDQFGKYLSNNVRYPADDRENGVSGRVILTMVVEKDGTLSNIKAVRGPSETLKAEAIRVLRTSPKWAPGFDKDGNPVRVSFTVPINYTLDTQE